MAHRPLPLPVVALSEDVGDRRLGERRLAFFVPKAANPPPKDPTPRAA